MNVTPGVFTSGGRGARLQRVRWFDVEPGEFTADGEACALSVEPTTVVMNVAPGKFTMKSMGCRMRWT